MTPRYKGGFLAKMKTPKRTQTGWFVHLKENNVQKITKKALKLSDRGSIASPKRQIDAIMAGSPWNDSHEKQPVKDDREGSGHRNHNVSYPH